MYQQSNTAKLLLCFALAYFVTSISELVTASRPYDVISLRSNRNIVRKSANSNKFKLTNSFQNCWTRRNILQLLSKTARPKPVNLWTVADVQKWFKRHCSEYITYAEVFLQHEITGRALLRITDNSLQRMGIENNRDREAIWREIVKQRLKTDIMEIRDMEFMNIYYDCN